MREPAASTRAIEEREWRDLDAGGWPQDDAIRLDRPWAEHPLVTRAGKPRKEG